MARPSGCSGVVKCTNVAGELGYVEPRTMSYNSPMTLCTSYCRARIAMQCSSRHDKSVSFDLSSISSNSKNSRCTLWSCCWFEGRAVSVVALAANDATIVSYAAEFPSCECFSNSVTQATSQS